MSNNWILGFTWFSWGRFEINHAILVLHWKKSLTSELLQLSRQAPSFEMIPSRHEKKFSSSRNFSFFESYPGKILTISFNQYFWIGITFTMSTDTLVPLKVNPMMKKITKLISHIFKSQKSIPNSIPEPVCLMQSFIFLTGSRPKGTSPLLPLTSE